MSKPLLFLLAVLATWDGRLARRPFTARARARAEVARLPRVTTVVSPYATHGQAIFARRDDRLATVNFDEKANVLPSRRSGRRSRPPGRELAVRAVPRRGHSARMNVTRVSRYPFTNVEGSPTSRR